MEAVIREYRDSDAQAFLEVHYAAVHKTAAAHYTPEILNEWSPTVNQIRIEKFKRENFVDVRIVAEVEGRVVGFGELIAPKNILNACYVHPDYSGRGIGKQILSRLEEIAKTKGLKYLFMDASLNAKISTKKADTKLRAMASTRGIADAQCHA